MGDDPIILSGGQVRGILRRVGVPVRALVVLADRSYAVPTVASFDRFGAWHGNELFRAGLSQWHAYWDCDDFARDFAVWAARRFAKDRRAGNAPEADAIAIFAHWWTPLTVAGPHATILAFVPADDAHPEVAHGVGLRCLEPQPRAALRVIPEGMRAWETTTFVR